MIELREEQGYSLHFLIQVDVLAHKIPNFIEKAARAGCRYVFIGLESINPENLVHMKKNQNRITEYRKMFQAWKEAGIVTYAGFIMGLPGDTPETIRRDIKIVQEELPVDLLEFTMLTPLPGSEDHQKLHEKGVWMDPDLNKYDLETVTVKHPRMSPEEWQRTYQDMWTWYYSDEHVERMMRRNVAYGIKPVRIVRSVLQVYGAPHFEGVHPQQCGYFRRKAPPRAEARAAARSGSPLPSRSRLADPGQIRAFRRLRLAAPPHAKAHPEGCCRQGLPRPCDNSGRRCRERNSADVRPEPVVPRRGRKGQDTGASPS